MWDSSERTFEETFLLHSVSFGIELSCNSLKVHFEVRPDDRLKKASSKRERNKKHNTEYTIMSVLKQKFTGIHLDSNAFNLWEREVSPHVYEPLDRFRPFQSFVALTDTSEKRNVKDGGLEVVPGFHHIMERYFQNHEAGYRGRRQTVGPYNNSFDESIDSWLYSEIQKCQRIPDDWKIPSEPVPPVPKDQKTEESIALCKKIVAEHKKLKYSPVKTGDFLLWDIRLAHQNSERNETENIRSVFYHAYLLAQPSHINQKKINEYKKLRVTRDHSSDFNRKWSNLEKTGFVPATLDTKLSKLLYDEEKWNDDLLAEDGEIGQILNKYKNVITDRHLAFFNRFGYVVIENAVSTELCKALFDQAMNHAKFAGCEIKKGVTKKDWTKIGGGFGAMVEFFWQPQQERIRFDEKLYAITSELFQKTWATKQGLFSHPIENVDGRKLWLYNDRMNMRIPDSWSVAEEQVGNHTASNNTTKSTKRTPPSRNLRNRF